MNVFQTIFVISSVFALGFAKYASWDPELQNFRGPVECLGVLIERGKLYRSIFAAMFNP